MSDNNVYTIGWICALATEYVAAQLFLDEEHEKPESVSDNDNNNYSLGKMGKHHVVIAVLPHGEYGISSATGVVKDMLNSFPNIRVGLMVGIGGGAPSPDNDIRLGDVVVSASGQGKGGVFQYDFGKVIQGRDYEETGFLNQPPTLLRTAVNGLLTRYKLKGHRLVENIEGILAQNKRLRKEFRRPDASTDRLYRATKVHPADDKSSCLAVCGDDASTLVERPVRDEDEDDPAIHYGLMASSNSLMKDALVRDRFAAKHGVLCFEMEAAGLVNHFPFLVIRGICDYSDSHKNKQWQGFAAMMAAAYAKDLLSEVLPNKIEAQEPLAESLKSIGEKLDEANKTGNETKQTITAMQSDNRVSKIERWLSAPDWSVNLNKARRSRHQGTGAWALEAPFFQEWKAGKRRHLWLYGMPGCGKTVLSATILDHLLQRETGDVLAFFFDFNDARKQTLESLVRSLAIQLYHLEAGGCNELDALFASHQDGKMQPGMNALEAYITSVVQRKGDMTLVIDALDECTTRNDLLKWMCSFAESGIRLLVTGRPEGEFQREIPPLFDKLNCVSLERPAVSEDIKSYVEASLMNDAKFKRIRLSQDLTRKIQAKVGDGAKGMFRWAACQLDSLSRCLSPMDVEEALKHLPETLNETYQRMRESIPPSLQEDSTRLLQFLVHTKQPLKVSEAKEILATHPREGFDCRRRVFDSSSILEYCPGLISIVRLGDSDSSDVDSDSSDVDSDSSDVDSDEDCENKREVHLAHFSVKEFLLDQRQLDLESASIVITGTCLAYLTDVEGSHDEINSRFPMARYASLYWAIFMVSAEVCEETVDAAVKFLQDKTLNSKWAGIKNRFVLKEVSGLYCACEAGLMKVARKIIAAGVDVNAQVAGGLYGNALQAASIGGFYEVAQLLLDHGANVKTQGGKYGNALQAASDIGSREVAQLLLDHGADVNTQGGRYGNALQAACSSGSREVVRLLLDHGADVNAQGGHYGNALQAASNRGSREVAQLLLDHGADANAQGGYYGNALQAASDIGSREVAQLLLDRGANVNAQGGCYRNALQAASNRGFREVAQLLLNHGADVNAQGGHYRNALQAASIKGSHEVARLLLDHGADINTQGGLYGNALQAASNRGSHEVAQLLLDHGADVNAQGGYCGNALQAACSSGFREVAQLLLDHGANVNAQESYYGNALQAACSSGSREVAQLLLDHGADVNAQGGCYGNALQAASNIGSREVAQLLLDRGADVNAQGGYYRNALQAASISGFRKVTQLLLNHGADANAQGGYYENALQAASDNGSREVA